MRKFLIVVLLLLSVLRVDAQYMSDREIIDAIAADRMRAACGYCPYSAPESAETPVPKGYKAFYVSNYSRHGSRPHGSEGGFDKTISAFAALDSARLLTPAGISFYNDLVHMRDAHKDKAGLLTNKGAKEQQGVAARLYGRVPEAFGRKDARIVSCTSTTAQRAIMSMANFATTLNSSSPSLEISYNVGFPEMPMFCGGARVTDRKEMRTEYKALEDSLKGVFNSSCSIFDKLCSDRAAGEALVGGDLHRFSYRILEEASVGGCLDIDVDPFGYFSPEELFEFFRIRNLYYSASYGYISPKSLERMHDADRMVRLMINEADAAIEGNGHCADLRFGHDAPVGPMQVLFDLEGFVNDAPVDSMYHYWQAWRNICMCTNVQLLFYRNRKSDILVRILVNEREARVNGLEAVDSVYYRWSDLRSHLLRRIGDSRELPESFKATLDAKAAEIRELQKNECDGFYFITDMHFPENSGNAAPAIRYLQENAGTRKVFFGGDMEANRDTFVETLFPTSCAFEQIRGGSRLYCVRGNHDCKTRTKPVDAPNITLRQWTTSRFLRRYISSDAVFAGEDMLHYYVDEPSAKMRYICLETSEIGENGLLVSGMQPHQMVWLIEEAILGTPRGWSVGVFCHIPLSSEFNRIKSLLKTGECLSALAGHGSFEFEGRTYDFSSRPDLKPLFVISGHRHKDAVDSSQGFPQILTRADKNNDEIRGELEEQAFDYFSISKDRKTITTVRIGAGENRTFKIK